MTSSALSLYTIARFVQLCAALDDGGAVRAEVLALAGLDEGAWQRLRADWIQQLAADEAPALAQHFGRAYAQARHHASRVRQVDSAATEDSGALPEFDTDDTQVDASPWMSDADGTSELAFPLAGPAVPFCVALPWSPLPRPALVVVSAALLPAIDPTEATLEVPCTSAPSHAVLPFAPANGRRQRLQRFDTQTGQPLAVPRWVDEPTPTPVPGG